MSFHYIYGPQRSDNSSSSITLNQCGMENTILHLCLAELKRGDRQTKKRTKKMCSKNLNNLFIINKNSHASVHLKNLRQKMAVFTLKSKHLKIIYPWGKNVC